MKEKTRRRRTRFVLLLSGSGTRGIKGRAEEKGGGVKKLEGLRSKELFAQRNASFGLNKRLLHPLGRP